VILDELRSDKVPFTRLLTMLDRYPCTVKTFYGMHKLVSHIMVITAPAAPEVMYAGRRDEDLKQLLRRITFTIEFLVDELLGDDVVDEVRLEEDVDSCCARIDDLHDQLGPEGGSAELGAIEAGTSGVCVVDDS